MGRNYVHERLIEDPKRKQERAARNRGRLKMVKAHGAAAMQNKQVEHKNGNALDNSAGNLKPISPARNNNGRAGGPAKIKKR
jgi:hypothetical protein